MFIIIAPEKKMPFLHLVTLIAVLARHLCSLVQYIELISATLIQLPVAMEALFIYFLSCYLSAKLRVFFLFFFLAPKLYYSSLIPRPHPLRGKKGLVNIRTFLSYGM